MHDLIANDLYLSSRAASLGSAAERRRTQLERVGLDAPTSRRVRTPLAWLSRRARQTAVRAVTPEWPSSASRHLPV